jgi:RNA-directed DNA polymerase
MVASGHGTGVRSGEVSSQMPDMYAIRKSDSNIVPKKQANKEGVSSAESVEGRTPTKRNTGQLPTVRTQGRGAVSSRVAGVRQAAQRRKDERFTALLHHVSVELLRKSYYDLKHNAAAGVDNVTWAEYGKSLEVRLPDLHDRIHRGKYRALPSKRGYVPKPDGGQRPLGIAALEDKIVQRALLEVLNQIYEVDFLGFSYGFRPGRNAHDALDALSVALTRGKVSWVLDADIRSYFDTIDHGWLMKFVEHRIADRRVLRLLRKWLQAGVLEEGQLTRTETGSPQGAVISPILANIFLHYVLDKWTHWWRRTQAKGNVIVVRYADDVVFGFQYRWEAEKFKELLKQRLAQFGLELHPEKTRLIEFGRFAATNRKQRGEGRPETFDFLGFTHICAKSRKGNYIVLRKTIRKRLAAKCRKIRSQIMQRMHDPIPEVGRWLRSVVIGYQNYFAVLGNMDAVHTLRDEVAKAWKHALCRRSQKGKRLNWGRFSRIRDYWIPRVQVKHPLPWERFDAKYSR